MSDPKQELEGIIKEVVQDVSIDTYLDRHPSLIKFPEDYKEMVRRLRLQRAQFIDAQEKKKAKKDGMVEVEDIEAQSDE